MRKILLLSMLLGNLCCMFGQGANKAPASSEVTGYCTTSLAGGSFDVNSLSITGTTLAYTGTTYSTTSDGSYYAAISSSSTNNTCNLTPGQTYSMTIGTSNSDIASLWIDYNQNGSFESTEWTQISTSISSGGTATASFTVPANATVGATSMRIRTRNYGNSNTSTDACSSFGSGCTLDFNVTIGSLTPAKPVANFSSVSTIVTPGSPVQFSDNSTGVPTSWKWTFTGGTPSTSQAQNPSVTYASAGKYDVKLVATNALGTDSIVKSSYITVTSAVTIPVSGSQSITTCDATIYDNGGTSTYSTYADGTLTIYPGTSGKAVRLDFSSFSLNSYDYLYVYNGTSTSATLIGTYTGTTIPAAVVASNVSGALTLRFVTSYYSNTGFVAKASCADLVLQTLSATSWSSSIDNNKNGYAQSKILNYTIKNDALTSSSVYAKIYSKQSSSSTYTLLTTTSTVSIGATTTFSQIYLVTGMSAKDNYDFKIELYNASNTLLNSYDVTNNSTLGGLSFESVSDDALSDFAVTTLGGSSYDMTAVSITGTTLNNTSTRPTTTSTGNYYVNWPASGTKTCTLTTGTNYTLNVTTNSSYNISVWIDYNQDKVFQASEWTQVASSTSYGVNNAVTFKIPNTALSGNTRMRIRTNYYYYSNTSTDATSTFYYGSTEDYTITIQPQVAAVPKTDFTVSETNICLGSTVQYTDNSTGVPANWKWVFDGGNPATSTSQNPSVTYNTVGVYPVKLVISNALGTDSLVKSSYINVTNTINVPASGSKSITACGVTVYDNGGTSNYANNSDGTLTIYPSTAKSAVRLQFSQFQTESWDYLYVYNGTSTSATQIGVYYGSTIPADIIATNASGALTLRFYSDGYSNYSGFTAQASCVPLYSQYLKTASWTNVVDNNYNGYAQSQVLNYTVQNDKPSAVNVYTKIYCNYNSKADSLLSTSSLFSIAASSVSGVKTYSVAGVNTQSNYNFKIELYNQADSLLSTYTSSTFSNLGSQKLESAAADGAPTYCTGSLGGGGFVLTGVAIKNTTLSNTATRTAVRTVDGSYFTDFQKSGTNTCSLNPGQTYTVSVTAASYYQIGMWIDFNHDSSFQSSEYTQVASYTTSSSTPAEVSFVVPTTAVSGDTKMRIRTLYYGNTMSGTDACTSFSTGCTEDYTITIAAVNNVAPVTAFVATPTSCSIGSQVQFTDLSTNIPTGWKWTFTGGTPSTSTSQNPTVVYANAGTYDVKLVARNAYGADSLVKSSYITVANSVLVPATGSTSITACGFTLYDNGGTSTYANSSSGSLTIYPGTTGKAVQIQFSEFQTESCDYLYVYDGTSTSATMIGSYSGSTIPSTITANNSTGALTLRFYSDGSVVYSGFAAQVSCVTLPSYSVSSASWTNSIDNNYNGYYQSRTLNLVARNNTSTKANVYAKIYYKLTTASTYTLYGQTTAFAINANSASETIIYNVTNLPTQGIYDLKIELYDSSNNLITTYSYSDDSDLKSQRFEPVSSDGVGYYCTSNLGGSASDITAVSVTGTTLNNTATRSSSSLYTTYSASGVYTGTLTWNAINTINVTTTNNDIVSMWIDYDHNSTFDASEWTLVSAASNSSAVSTSFYIPSTALTGQTRMRIRTRSAGTSNFSTDACTNFSSGCTEDYTITIDKLNDVNDVSSTLLKLYPNPVSDKLKITIPGFYKGTLQVMDVVGRKVIATEVSGEEFEQNVSDLKTGVYFIQIKSENGQTFNKEFMVRH